VTPPRRTLSSVWVFSLQPIDGVPLRRRLDDGSDAHRIDGVGWGWRLCQRKVEVS